jgi:hypothetical protein
MLDEELEKLPFHFTLHVFIANIEVYIKARFPFLSRDKEDNNIHA